MESYQEFLNRIHGFEKPELHFAGTFFNGNPSLARKIRPDNTFCDFFGDTVVFDLDEKVKDKLSECLNKLYVEVPECFCERLHTDTFHMTLHDLSNSERLTGVAADVFVNELKIRELSKGMKVLESIKMRSSCIFNMVNTSLVLGLYPTDEKEYKKLIELYQVFDSVKKLEYPLTPHITLAYYNVNGFEETAAKKLEKLVYWLNTSGAFIPFEVELKYEALYYQKFINMNEYTNVLAICKNR